jgi:gamma-glutamyltranspeptidase/glutathione hydrolase
MKYWIAISAVLFFFSAATHATDTAHKTVDKDVIYQPSRYASTSADGKAAVATVNPYATSAALDVVARGGNAIDAALAAAFTLGVVDGQNSGIGGGCFIVVRFADGRILAIDGREMAPAAAHRDMYLVDGKADPDLSRTGALAIGIPGSVAALHELQRLGGKLKFSDVLLPAATLAEEGFNIAPNMAERLARTTDNIARFPASADIFLDKAGKPRPAFSQLQQKDLANTYRLLAAQGPNYFYKGDFAKQTAAWMKKNGGIITAKDFSGYEIKLRDPVVSQFAGHTIYGFPSPSSGGTHVAQILNTLAFFELKKMPQEERQHILAEAVKFAFADRAHWLGDSDFIKVPAGLVDTRYAKSIAEKINTQGVTEGVSHGNPAVDIEALMNKHTTHISTADLHGNWVSITTTVNTSFGSKVVIPGTGVVMNNQMDDFSAQQGAANAFGLVGSEANSIQPRKRPLSSMSPTLVLKDGKPVMTLGAAGGPTIISQVVQALLYTLLDNMPVEDALAQPRLHQQWSPNTLLVESAVSADIQQSLTGKGHTLRVWPSMGAAQAIQLRDGKLYPVTDPRVIAQNSLPE